MARHGRRLPKMSRYVCSQINEAIADEKKGANFYRHLSKSGKKEGMARADYFQIMHAYRDEKKHKRWMLKYKKKYCR